MKTRWLNCVQCPQYSIRLEALGYLHTSYLIPAFDEAKCHVAQQLMVIGCLRLSDVSVICRVVNPHPTCLKSLGYVLCTDCTGQGNDFELISTVKIKTRNPFDGYFGRETPATCKCCGVMAAESPKTLIFFEKFFAFFEKWPLKLQRVHELVSFNPCTIQYGRFRCAQKLTR